MTARLFPGQRPVWVAAGVVLGAVVVVLLVYLAVPRERFTGSNSTAARDAIAVVDGGQRVCVPRAAIPADTGQVRLAFDTRESPTPAINLLVRSSSGYQSRSRLPASDETGFRKADIPIARTPPGQEAINATVCLSPTSGRIFLWGRAQLAGDQLPPLLDRQPVRGQVALWFLPPRGQDQASLLSQVPQIFERASLFRPGFVGPWTYWAIFLVVFPLIAYGAIRAIARADEASGRRLPLGAWVVVISFCCAASWALITPAFQTPDEPEHYAAVEYFAQTGNAVERVAAGRNLYSDDETIALEGMNTLTVIERADVKSPWLGLDERTWSSRTNSRPPPRKDSGGGFHPATSSHSPAYYALVSPAYLVASGGSTFTRVTAVRLASAAMAALTALCAFFLVGCLFPARRSLAVAGGLMVGMQPMFTFIGGGINNDNAVNLACALVILLTVIALRKGFSWWLAIGLGLALGLAPVFKGTGYSMYPPVLFALVAYLLRRHSLRDFASVGVVAAGCASVFLLWQKVSESFDRSAFTTPGGGTPGVSFGARSDPAGYLSWMWQNLVPVRLPFMTDFTLVKWPLYDIYVREGFGAFGWYAIFFQEWVYVFIGAVLGILVLSAARLLWVRRDALKRLWPEATFIGLVPITVVFAVGAAYFTLQGLPLDGTGEQGRYGFPAITAVAALSVAGCLGFGERRARWIAAALVSGLGGLLVASWALSLSSFYA